jgi:molybdopterin-guanine dinucleotide biosynthesis protein A
MGTDKALLPFGVENLLELAISRAKGVSPTPIIVGDRNRYSPYGEVIEDRFPHCGPLGGIHAALCATQTDLNLVLSVDMPLMRSDFLIWLARLAASGNAMAVVPETQGRRQPLCAVYRSAARPVVEQALNRGEFKVGHIFSLIPACYVKEDEIAEAGFSPDIFRNVNTRDDYEAVRNLREQGPPLFSESQGK